MGNRVREQIEALRRKEKAPSHLPEHLRGRVHLFSSEASHTLDAELNDFADYASAYKVFVWLRKAVSVIANALAPLPVRVEDGDGKELPSHPVSEVLEWVNDQTSADQLWERWLVHMMLGGESFLQVVLDRRERPSEIWPRRPDHVGVTPDESRSYYPAVSEYVFNPISPRRDENSLHIPPEQMIHFMFANPLNPYRGLNPAAAIRNSIVIDLFAQSWAKAFFKRGARPDWALVAPEGITPTEREGYRQKVIEMFRGADNWFEPIILERGITDVKMFSWPPADVQWLERQQFTRDEVGGLYGVPDEIMGYGKDTYENMENAYRWFWLLTVMNLIRKRDRTLTAHFRKKTDLLRPGERVATDTSEISVLQEDMTEKLPLVDSLWSKGVPLNTIDERLGLGLGPVLGGDVGYVPFSVYPVGEPGVRSEAERSALVAVTKSPRAPDYGSPRHKSLWKAAVAVYAPHERRMKAKLQEDFGRQRDQVLEALEGQEGKTLAERVFEVRALTKQEREDWYPQEVDEIFDLEEWVAYFILAYEAFYTDVVRASAQNMLSTGLGLETIFDMGHSSVQRAILEMRIQFATDINETTQAKMREALREILAEADREGWGIPHIQEQIKERISDVFHVRESDYERERIARTEMHKAAERGSYQGAKQSGLELEKSWLAALDGRERETHREAHFRYQDNPIALDAYFEVGADRMREPGGGSLPEEVINCRCTTLYLPVEVEA